MRRWLLVPLLVAACASTPAAAPAPEDPVPAAGPSEPPPDVIVHALDAAGRPLTGRVDVDVRGVDGRFACVQVEADASGRAPLLLVEGRQIRLHGAKTLLTVPVGAPAPFDAELRLDDGLAQPPWTGQSAVAVEVRDLPVADGTVAYALTRMKSPEILQWRSRVRGGRATFHPPARLWWIEVHPVRPGDPAAVAPRTVVLAPAGAARNATWTGFTGPADTVKVEPSVRADGTIEISWHQLVPRQ